MVWFWAGPDAYPPQVVDATNAKAGLLWQWGALDFAGGTVVHINAGVAGLVGAYMVGKQVGYGREAFTPHSLTLTMVGAALLWVGWFGFNAGSWKPTARRLAFMNTFIATAAAVMSWTVAEWMLKASPRCWAQRRVPWRAWWPSPPQPATWAGRRLAIGLISALPACTRV